MTTEEFRLPPATASIMDALRKEGGHVMAAGPCVRDSLLGKEPDIWDVYCNLSLEAIAGFLDAGEVHDDSVIIRVKETEKRKGFWIRIYTTRDPFVELLMEKDFTINAIGYDHRWGFIDPAGGRYDLEEKLIRAVDEPENLFRRDALSMFAAIETAARYGFAIETRTRVAIRHLAKEPYNANIFVREKMMDGLSMVMCSENAKDALELMVSTELIIAVMGNAGIVNELTSGSKLEALAAHINETEDDILTRVGLFYMAIGGNAARRAIQYLPYEKETHEQLMDLIDRMGDLSMVSNIVAFKDLLGSIGKVRYEYLDSMERYRDQLFQVAAGNRAQRDGYLKTIEENGDPVYRSDRARTLGDLRSMGMTDDEANAAIGRLLEAVHLDPSLNTKEQLRDLAVKKKPGLAERLGLGKLFK